MDTQLKDKLIQKIQKLIALSASPNEAEAALASERVKELLVKYNLSQTDINSKEFDGVVKQEDYLNGLKIQSFKRILILGITTFYNCEILESYNRIKKEHKIIIIGREINIIGTKIMFEYLLRVIESLAKNINNQRLNKMDYKKGISVGLYSRMLKIKEAQNKKGIEGVGSGHSLMVLDHQLKIENKNYINNFGKLGTSKRKYDIEYNRSYMAGYQDSERISLNEQIDRGDGKRKQLEVYKDSLFE